MRIVESPCLQQTSLLTAQIKPHAAHVGKEQQVQDHRDPTKVNMVTYSNVLDGKKSRGDTMMDQHSYYRYN